MIGIDSVERNVVIYKGKDLNYYGKGVHVQNGYLHCVAIRTEGKNITLKPSKAITEETFEKTLNRAFEWSFLWVDNSERLQDNNEYIRTENYTEVMVQDGYLVHKINLDRIVSDYGLKEDERECSCFR